MIIKMMTMKIMTTRMTTSKTTMIMTKLKKAFRTMTKRKRIAKKENKEHSNDNSGGALTSLSRPRVNNMKKKRQDHSWGGGRLDKASG